MSKIKCITCGKMYTKRGLSRHLKSCKKLKEKYNEGVEQNYYKIKIYTNLGYGYFLFIDIKENATLRDLDGFLRNIWFDHWEHASGFEFNDESYLMYSDNDANKELREVISINEDFKYEYDFGTTTVLHLKAFEAVKGEDRENKIEILARNEQHEYKCEKCGNKATHVFANWNLEYYCEEHLENSDEKYYLPIVNSPRMGVDYYSG